MARVGRSRRAGRKLGRIVLGLVLVGAGLFVIANASMVTDLVSAYVGPDAGGNAGSETFEGYLPFLVWGFAFSLIGSGGAILRGAVMSAGAGGGLAGGMDPTDFMDAYLQQSMSAIPVTGVPAGQAEPREVVRIKCRNCGSLEAEDASFCRKCGEPL